MSGANRNLDMVQALGKKRVLEDFAFIGQGAITPNLPTRPIKGIGAYIYRLAIGYYYLILQDVFPEIIDVDAQLQNVNPFSSSLPPWPGAVTAVAVGLQIQQDGLVFAASTGGTTGGSGPTFDVTPGALTTDGSVVWTTMGPNSDVEVDAGIPIQNPFNLPIWQPATAYGSPGPTLLDPSLPVFYIGTGPAGGSSLIVAATIAGISGSTVPAFPTTPGDTVLDGTVLWTTIGPLPPPAEAIDPQSGTFGAIIPLTINSKSTLAPVDFGGVAVEGGFIPDQDLLVIALHGKNTTVAKG